MRLLKKREFCRGQCVRLQDELDELRKSTEKKLHDARRSTMFGGVRLREDGAKLDVLGTGRRRSSAMVTEVDGSKKFKDSSTLLSKFFKTAKDSMPGNKDVDLAKLDAFELCILEGNRVFEELARASGVTLSSRGVLDSVLMRQEMAKNVTQFGSN